MGQESDEDILFFWTEVVPAWKSNRLSMSKIETTATTWRTKGMYTSPVKNANSTMKFFVRDDMQKMEWHRNDQLRMVFGTDSERTFSAGRADSTSPLVVRSVAHSGRTSMTQDPLVRDFAKLFSAICVHPGRYLDRFNQLKSGIRIDGLQRKPGNQVQLVLQGTKYPETFKLLLDGTRCWAILEWEHERSGRLSRGKNEYYETSIVGGIFPKTVRVETVVGGSISGSGTKTEFVLPVECNLPASAFRLSHYGLGEPAIPKNTVATRNEPTEFSYTRGKSIPLLACGLILIGLALWIKSRRGV